MCSAVKPAVPNPTAPGMTISRTQQRGFETVDVALGQTTRGGDCRTQLHQQVQLLQLRTRLACRMEAHLPGSNKTVFEPLDGQWDSMEDREASDLECRIAHDKIGGGVPDRVGFDYVVTSCELLWRVLAMCVSTE